MTAEEEAEYLATMAAEKAENAMDSLNLEANPIGGMAQMEAAFSIMFSEVIYLSILGCLNFIVIIGSIIF